MDEWMNKMWYICWVGVRSSEPKAVVLEWSLLSQCPWPGAGGRGMIPVLFDPRPIHSLCSVLDPQGQTAACVTQHPCSPASRWISCWDLSSSEGGRTEGGVTVSLAYSLPVVLLTEAVFEGQLRWGGPQPSQLQLWPGPGPSRPGSGMALLCPLLVPVPPTSVTSPFVKPWGCAICLLPWLAQYLNEDWGDVTGGREKGYQAAPSS